MKYFEHITFEERKVITNLLTTRNSSAKEIGDLLHKDPTTISKEVRRNRYESRPAYKTETDTICKHTLRYPYVCNGCNLRRNIKCKYKQYLYDPLKAQKKSEYNLRVIRAGINMSKEEFEALDKKISDAIKSKRSIYDVVASKEVNVSTATIYRYIEKNLLSVSKKDLSYTAGFKPRKKKEYEYNENRKIDRNNRTYLDYLAYINSHPNIFINQMDFLGTIKTDSNCILTLTIPSIHFVMLFLVEKKNSNKVVSLFNQLEAYIGLDNFKQLFPCILTDRDPSFSDFIGIEFALYTGEERTHIFYCDAYVSNQKGSVENMNKQLRRYFPKKASVDSLNDNYIKTVMHQLNDRRVKSLSGYSPNEAFIKTYSKELLNKVYEFIYK